MTNFAAHARRVRDAGVPTVRRRPALGGCISEFPAYGYQATWAKLVDGRRIATHRHGTTHVPDLLDALEELEDARRVWLAASARYRARRRQEKAVGSAGRGPGASCCCPSPTVATRVSSRAARWRTS